MRIHKALLLACFLISAVTLQAKENRWVANSNHSVQWETNKGELPYNDHIEMSGLRASVVYYWGVDGAKRFAVDRHLVFPMLRTIPWTDTWCSLCSEPYPTTRTPAGCPAATWIS